MKLPDGDRAIVAQSKLGSYLLSLTHPLGKSKARFFRGLGFNETNLDLLEQGLLEIALSAEVIAVESSPHGIKYVIDGLLQTPMGNTVQVRTVWIIDAGQARPRLVTAYPL